MKAIGFLTVVVLTIGSYSATARAEDSNGSLLMRLFENICIPNMGRPEKVRAFAEAQKLSEITNPQFLAVFVGVGTKGAAWQVPSPTPQKFALSIRGTSEGCAVWAEQADPNYVESAFIKLVEGTAQPGIKVEKDKEFTNQTKFGLGKAIMYHMFSPDSGKGMEFTLITGEKPGGFFQASIQVAPVAAR
jgi:hypothetical protein